MKINQAEGQSERKRKREFTVTMAVRPKKWELITVPMTMALVFSLYATADDH
jgi:hypothetical protein